VSKNQNHFDCLYNTVICSPISHFLLYLEWRELVDLLFDYVLAKKEIFSHRTTETFLW